MKQENRVKKLISRAAPLALAGVLARCWPSRPRRRRRTPVTAARPRGDQLPEECFPDFRDSSDELWDIDPMYGEVDDGTDDTYDTYGGVVLLAGSDGEQWDEYVNETGTCGYEGEGDRELVLPSQTLQPDRRTTAAGRPNRRSRSSARSTCPRAGRRSRAS